MLNILAIFHSRSLYLKTMDYNILQRFLRKVGAMKRLFLCGILFSVEVLLFFPLFAPAYLTSSERTRQVDDSFLQKPVEHLNLEDVPESLLQIIDGVEFKEGKFDLSKVINGIKDGTIKVEAKDAQKVLGTIREIVLKPEVYDLVVAAVAKSGINKFLLARTSFNPSVQVSILSLPAVVRNNALGKFKQWFPRETDPMELMKVTLRCSDGNIDVLYKDIYTTHLSWQKIAEGIDIPGYKRGDVKKTLKTANSIVQTQNVASLEGVNFPLLYQLSLPNVRRAILTSKVFRAQMFSVDRYNQLKGNTEAIKFHLLNTLGTIDLILDVSGVYGKDPVAGSEALMRLAQDPLYVELIANYIALLEKDGLEHKIIETLSEGQQEVVKRFVGSMTTKDYFSAKSKDVLTQKVSEHLGERIIKFVENDVKVLVKKDRGFVSRDFRKVVLKQSLYFRNLIEQEEARVGEREMVQVSYEGLSQEDFRLLIDQLTIAASIPETVGPKERARRFTSKVKTEPEKGYVEAAVQWAVDYLPAIFGAVGAARAVGRGEGAEAVKTVGATFVTDRIIQSYKLHRFGPTSHPNEIANAIRVGAEPIAGQAHLDPAIIRDALVPLFVNRFEEMAAKGERGGYSFGELSAKGRVGGVGERWVMRYLRHHAGFASDTIHEVARYYYFKYHDEIKSEDSTKSPLDLGLDYNLSLQDHIDRGEVWHEITGLNQLLAKAKSGTLDLSNFLLSDISNLKDVLQKRNIDLGWIKEINLNANRVVNLQVSEFSNLKKLFLQHNQLGKLDIEFLSPSIEVLDLEGNELRDINVESLFKRCPQLKILNVNQNLLSKQTLDALAAKKVELQTINRSLTIFGESYASQKHPLLNIMRNWYEEARERLLEKVDRAFKRKQAAREVEKVVEKVDAQVEKEAVPERIADVARTTERAADAAVARDKPQLIREVSTLSDLAKMKVSEKEQAVDTVSDSAFSSRRSWESSSESSFYTAVGEADPFEFAIERINRDIGVEESAEVQQILKEHQDSIVDASKRFQEQQDRLDSLERAKEDLILKERDNPVERARLERERAVLRRQKEQLSKAREVIERDIARRYERKTEEHRRKLERVERPKEPVRAKGL